MSAVLAAMLCINVWYESLLYVSFCNFMTWTCISCSVVSQATLFPQFNPSYSRWWANTICHSGTGLDMEWLSILGKMIIQNKIKWGDCCYPNDIWTEPILKPFQYCLCLGGLCIFSTCLRTRLNPCRISRYIIYQRIRNACSAGDQDPAPSKVQRSNPPTPISS